MQLELFFDFGSHYSYPAVMTADEAARQRGHTIVHRPFLLGPIATALGFTAPPFVQFPQKGEYTMRDLERICAELGLGWKRPTTFPRKAVLATRIALLGFDEGWGLAFSRRVYQLNFADDRDLEDEPTLRALLKELGQDDQAVLARAQSAANRDRLRNQVARAQELGVFGAPTFVVGRELFWGGDRMRQALDWADRERA